MAFNLVGSAGEKMYSIALGDPEGNEVMFKGNRRLKDFSGHKDKISRDSL